MKQLRLFDMAIDHDAILPKPNIWELFIDGAARNNPGPASVGIFMVKNGTPFCNHGFFLGKKTNNQAEYLAFIIGIILLKQEAHQEDRVHVFSDSQLLVRQIEGRYAVKNAELVVLHTIAKKIARTLAFEIHHIPREKNESADAMANRALDLVIPLPEYITTILQEHGFKI